MCFLSSFGFSVEYLFFLLACVPYTDGDWGVGVECRCCCGDLEGET
jgi:hypothetical protein